MQWSRQIPSAHSYIGCPLQTNQILGNQKMSGLLPSVDIYLTCISRVEHVIIVLFLVKALTNFSVHVLQVQKKLSNVRLIQEQEHVK